MKTIVSKITRRPSTDRAISGITKALTILEKVVAAEDAKIDKLQGEIDAKAVQRMDAFTRRDRAKNVASKFADLIG